MPKILLTNHHLIYYAGSELVTLDLATEFQRRGWNVTVATFRFGGDIEKNFNERGIKVVNVLNKPLSESEAEFDIVWSHHYPVLIKCLIEDSVKTKCLILSSLSPYEPLEAIPFFHSLTELVLCNSEETKQEIQNYISCNEEKLFVFKNSVPSNWFDILQDKFNASLKNIAVISNHPPAEILDAIEILKSKGIVTDLIGLSGKFQLVSADLLSAYDAVITIGRTVQHSMSLSIPIFCYDHFGGPGWLTPDNFQRAEWFNYSGRCCYQRFTSEQIVDHLIQGFHESKKYISFFKNYAIENYSLTKNIDAVLTYISHKKTEGKDYIDFSSKRVIGKVGHVYRRILNERETLQVELERSQSQLQQRQTELEQSQAQLQHTQVELERSQSQLQQRQTELEQSQAQLQHTQVELERSQAQLQHTQVELERSQSQLQHTQVELERSQSQLQHTQAELERSQNNTSEIFHNLHCKLQNLWLKFKQISKIKNK
ncbi:MAG: hypothetical protein AB3A66_08375 [Nodularia sp. CChRGM 3473]